MTARRHPPHCPYCSVGTPSTDDHIFARAFFPKNKREKHPKVMACQLCAVKKSKLEEYVMNSISFAGRHSDAVEMANISLDVRLKKNQKMARELAAGVIVGDGVSRSSTIEVDVNKHLSLSCMWSQGLSWVAFDHLTSPGDSISAAIADFTYGRSFVYSIGPCITWNKSFGSGAVTVLGTQSATDGRSQRWMFNLYDIRLAENVDESAVFLVDIGPK